MQSKTAPACLWHLTMHPVNKCRLAVDAMVDIALRDALGPVALRAIASRQQISLSYLEQVFSTLRRHGLVSSTRGPGGGYSIAKPMETITMSDIIDAVATMPSKPGQTDATGAPDMTRALCQALDAVVLDFMQAVTLKSLVQEQLARGLQIESACSPTRGVLPRPLAPANHPRTANWVFALGPHAQPPA